jgi:hypothetical protein
MRDGWGTRWFLIGQGKTDKNNGNSGGNSRSLHFAALLSG